MSYMSNTGLDNAEILPARRMTEKKVANTDNQDRDSLSSDRTSSMSDDGEDENDDGEDENDDDEEDEAPLLRYSRITNLPKSYFGRDSISACFFHDIIFLFGTHSGLLHMTSTKFEAIKTIKCHRSSILSIYTDGQTFATASIDGTVVIGSIAGIRGDPVIDSQLQLTAFDFKRPINSVVLDTNYVATKTFVSGGMAGDVILSQRNWLGNRTDNIISENKGPILGIFKIDEILFWINESGIQFWDIPSKVSLLKVPFDKGQMSLKKDFRYDLFRPHVHFPEIDRIIVGWGDNVWLFKATLSKRQNGEDNTTHLGSVLSSAASSLRVTPERSVKLEKHFIIQCLIAGITSFKDDQLLCLAFDEVYDKNDELVLKGLPPQLKVYEVDTGEEVHSDEIVTKNFSNLSINDYHLGKHISQNSQPEYYLISASDSIKIQELTLHDHFNWFLERDIFLDAWKLGRYVTNDSHRLSIGIKAIEQLIRADKWDKVSENMGPILEEGMKSNDAETATTAGKEWNVLINEAIKSDNIQKIVKHLPVDSEINSEIFDLVLEYLMNHKLFDLFSQTIALWPTSLFTVGKIESMLEDKIAQKDDNEADLVNQLIYLYLKEERYSKAIPYMIAKKDKRALDILTKQDQLLPRFFDDILEILVLPYDGDLLDLKAMSMPEIGKCFFQSIELIVKNRQMIKFDRFLHLFHREENQKLRLDKILLCILNRIDKTDPDLIKPYEDEMIQLYSKYDKQNLLNFLKKKATYDVEKAIDLCSSQKGLYNELIYLWGKIGESKKALSIIVDELNDPKLAIDFVRSWGNDPELIDFLIGYTVDKSNFVGLLLESSEQLGHKYVNVIKGIDDSLKVNNIQENLSKLFKENELNMDVNKKILKLVEDEATKYALELMKLRNKGMLFYLGDDNKFVPFETS
ncbi:hypothetical protein KAFR_0C02500 [Kazachstania africana CBS 2517]|uniref:Vacuolar protein sorting-associated protein 41 n=1 Tax=Kazachstania africana (strain ATCC 22294 / BCRC 22015 / CBS 2517 / CECT 1963 / NBRC 1671 / NRRL Y-8276) TaxID=1071382 RepID=H2AS93_KAZAF|nr:hypothetical protein KAFR_0C02500 [Kazachstania africana CBS 2517]CCF57243.1 hypothetical protein KAFR_0C02500 [Kazachstania africana CBS 2517]